MKHSSLVLLLVLLSSFSFQSDFGLLVQRRHAVGSRYETLRSLPAFAKLRDPLALHYYDMVGYSLASFDEDTVQARFYESLDRKGELPVEVGRHLISKLKGDLYYAESYTDSLQMLVRIEEKK